MNLNVLIQTKNDCYTYYNSRGTTHTPSNLFLHSTGANNPYIKRYVGPDDGIVGYNSNGNHWNRSGVSACLHGWIGKLNDGSIGTYQTLPWNMPGWHSGRCTASWGQTYSANSTGYIGFEICEDGLTDQYYFAAVYQEAVEVYAYLCNMFNLKPSGIICHSEGYKMGIASNHADVMHWFPKFGKSMDTFRADVAAELYNIQNPVIVPVTPVVTISEWAKDAQAWVMFNGVSDGNRPRDSVTNEELWTMLYKGKTELNLQVLVPSNNLASSWAQAAQRWAIAKAIDPNGFNPKNVMTRSEVWDVLYLACSKGEYGKPGTLATTGQTWCQANNISDGNNGASALEREQLWVMLHAISKM